MTDEQILNLKRKIARGCLIVLICITVFGTFLAFNSDEKGVRELKEQIHSAFENETNDIISVSENISK